MSRPRSIYRDPQTPPWGSSCTCRWVGGHLPWLVGLGERGRKGGEGQSTLLNEYNMLPSPGEKMITHKKYFQKLSRRLKITQFCEFMPNCFIALHIKIGVLSRPWNQPPNFVSAVDCSWLRNSMWTSRFCSQPKRFTKTIPHFCPITIQRIESGRER